MARTVMLVITTIKKTTSVIQITRRNRSVADSSLIRCTENIAAPSNGVNQRLLGAALQLGTEPIDVDLDDVGRPFPVRFPQAFAQHGARDDLAGMAHEHFENAELRWRQVNVHAA